MKTTSTTTLRLMIYSMDVFNDKTAIPTTKDKERLDTKGS